MKLFKLMGASLAALSLMLAVTTPTAVSTEEPEPVEFVLLSEEPDEGRIPGDDVPAAEPASAEENENDRILEAMLDKGTQVTCTVTWYTKDTCGKKPSHPAYGITASGLPAKEHLTCAVDRRVIPLYSDVFVQYKDGTVEQFWATDTGVIGNAVDIYTESYDYAIQMGRQTLNVWFVPPEAE